jgi:hypothetical protein
MVTALVVLANIACARAVLTRLAIIAALLASTQSAILAIGNM